MRRATPPRPEAPEVSARMTRRAVVLGSTQLAVMGLIGWRMKALQIDQADEFRLLAEENRINMRLIPPARRVMRAETSGASGRGGVARLMSSSRAWSRAW